VADPGKHWSPKGKGRPSYSLNEMDEAQDNSPLAVCRHHGGDIKVEIEYLGEGFDGDWDPSDPGDMPLVRFRVFDQRREEGDEEYDSYSTQIPATMPLVMMESFACALAEVLAHEDRGWKRLLQEWSWTTEKDVRRIHKKRMEKSHG
jgi:hypothetical protein